MKKKSIVLLVLFTLFNLFIFYEALTPAVGSSEQSDTVAKIIVDIVEAFGEKLTEAQSQRLSHNVRKLIGHYGLFAIDGILGLTFFFSLDKNKKYEILFACLSGLSVAIIAELLQLFPEGRSCEVLDMLINFSGYLTGVLVTIIVGSIYLKAKKRRSRNGKQAEINS